MIHFDRTCVRPSQRERSLLDKLRGVPTCQRFRRWPSDVTAALPTYNTTVQLCARAVVKLLKAQHSKKTWGSMNVFSYSIFPPRPNLLLDPHPNFLGCPCQKLQIPLSINAASTAFRTHRHTHQANSLRQTSWTESQKQTRTTSPTQQKGRDICVCSAQWCYVCVGVCECV